MLIQLLDENEGYADSQDSSYKEEEVITATPIVPLKFKAKSQKFPNLQTCPAVWAFLKQTTKQIEGMQFPKRTINNLSLAQQSALKNLMEKEDLVIKPSDKGGNVVLMNREDYINMCLHILNNQEWYQQVPAQKLIEARSNYLTIIDQAYQQGLIDKDTREFLEVKWPITPTFYSLPKVHKNIVNPPAHPIISGIGSHTQTASQYVDGYLRPHVTSLPSYLKDTLDLLKILEGLTIPQGAILAAIDIEALYSSIPHTKGIEVVSEFLRERDTNSWELGQFIILLLERILTNNMFLFNGVTYLQVQGVAMGTSCAPSYANLYLGGWERTLFSSEGASMYLRHILLWRRCIDDVLLIWTGSTNLLSDFMEFLSQNNFNLKFTIQSDAISIPFLDLRLVLKEDGSVFSTLYRKETAGNTILHFSSSHPCTLVHSIPYSQYLRLRRNCVGNEDFEREAKALYRRLLVTIARKSSKGPTNGQNQTHVILSYSNRKYVTPILLPNLSPLSRPINSRSGISSMKTGISSRRIR
ncbi:uncharacterized protein [Aquarana catesbeiana]|uniref:uncharacterized protein n=1 Tax=Aquarana catesbeiana TaxID=8400 RepID=UPI003CCA633A